MKSSIKPIPDGYHSLTPYLMIRSAAAAIEFYKQAFGAVELFRIPGMTPDSIGHAELKIGDSIIMLADECPGPGRNSPQGLGGTAVSFMLYVTDVDAAYPKALAAGATVLHPLQDKFYGDRAGTLLDPYSHIWTLASHIEDVPPEELESRAAAELAKMQSQG